LPRIPVEVVRERQAAHAKCNAPPAKAFFVKIFTIFRPRWHNTLFANAHFRSLEAGAALEARLRTPFDQQNRSKEAAPSRAVPKPVDAASALA
jgi:hypothetical protein